MDKKALLRKNMLVFIIMNGALLLFAICYTIYFNITEGTPSQPMCIFKELFGFYCPGCGGSRSLRALLSFRFVDSFILYPPLIISAAVVLSYDVRLALSIFKKDTSYTDNYRFYPFIIIAAALILNFFIRNIFLLFGVDFIGDIIPSFALLSPFV